MTNELDVIVVDGTVCLPVENVVGWLISVAEEVDKTDSTVQMASYQSIGGFLKGMALGLAEAIDELEE